jgi:flagellar FliL protein
MKKNLLTIIVLAMAFINIVLSAIIIFVIVPTSNKTNSMLTKVANIIDLELESPEDSENQISVSDIETYDVADKLTINLKKSDDNPHYAVVYVSISMNKKHKDFATLQPLVEKNVNEIKEYVTDEFSKYTVDEVLNNKNKIKESVKTKLQDYFKSDFIINVSFGNLILQ